MDIIRPLHRRFIQILAALLTNQELLHLTEGRLYKGSAKQLCAPGLNCYSCPAATLSCPIGALQTVGGTAGFGLSFYAGGFLLLLGVLWGRLACGFLCPFGLFQELLAKIPLPQKRLYAPLRYLKYLVLLVFVLGLPLFFMLTEGIGPPAFCQYICPAGTLEAALPLLLTHPEYRAATGSLFALKAAILAAVTIACMSIPRFFCKSLCPLGALYGLMNHLSICRLHLDKDRCTSCGTCQKACPMDIDPREQKNSPECIRCGRCTAACPHRALKLGVKIRSERKTADYLS